MTSAVVLVSIGPGDTKELTWLSTVAPTTVRVRVPDAIAPLWSLQAGCIEGGDDARVTLDLVREGVPFAHFVVARNPNEGQLGGEKSFVQINGLEDEPLITIGLAFGDHAEPGN